MLVNGSHFFQAVSLILQELTLEVFDIGPNPLLVDLQLLFSLKYAAYLVGTLLGGLALWKQQIAALSVLLIIFPQYWL